MLLIGCHTDKLHSRDPIKRNSNIARRYELAQATTDVGSAFGGLVY